MTDSASARTRAGRKDKPALDRQTIISHALSQIDEKGVGNLTLRGLASSLGVYPTAIYWHIPTKNDLLAAVAGQVFRDVAPRRASLSWQDYLKAIFHRFRSSVAAHPNVAPLVGTHLIANLSIDFDFVEAVLSALVDAGLSGPKLAHGYNAVIAAMIGFVAQEFSPLPEDDTSVWQSAVRERLLGVDGAVHPVLARNLSALANRAFILRWENGRDAPLDNSFEAYLDIFIAGIAALATNDD